MKNPIETDQRIIKQFLIKYRELENWKETTITEKQLELFKSLGNKYQQRLNVILDGISSGKVRLYKSSTKQKLTGPVRVRKKENPDSFEHIKRGKNHKGAEKTSKSIFPILTPMGNKN